MQLLKKSLLALSLSCLAVASTVAMAEDKCTTYGQITVTGKGEVKAAPDRAQLHYRVSAIKDSPEEARVEVEKTVKAFSDSVATLNLGENAFVADNITIMPHYEYNQELKKTELKGYEAARDVNINIKDFALIGKLTDMAIKAGINQIAGFQYSIENRRQYELEAAKKAIADAKERAQLLADGFEVNLGKPCQISFGSDRGHVVPYRYANAKMAVMDAAPAEAGIESTYKAEPMVISSSVSAVFGIKKPSQD